MLRPQSHGNIPKLVAILRPSTFFIFFPRAELTGFRSVIFLDFSNSSEVVYLETSAASCGPNTFPLPRSRRVCRSLSPLPNPAAPENVAAFFSPRRVDS